MRKLLNSITSQASRHAYRVAHRYASTLGSKARSIDTKGCSYKPLPVNYTGVSSIIADSSIQLRDKDTFDYLSGVARARVQLSQHLSRILLYCCQILEFEPVLGQHYHVD